MKAESPSVSIVLLGKFKPSSFLPDKLIDAKLIPKKLAESVSYVTLIPDVQVQFKLAWGEILVVRDRFQVSSSEAPYIRVCDFVVKALTDLASDSKVHAFGINREAHYNLGSNDARNEFGTRIAPPEAWGSWGKKLRDSQTGTAKGTSMQGGVINIQMRLPFLADGITGWLDITAAPSGLIENSSGVHFRANHHHQAISRILQAEMTGEKLRDVPEAENPSDVTARLMALLSECFENSLAESESIFEGVISR